MGRSELRAWRVFVCSAVVCFAFSFAGMSNAMATVGIGVHYTCRDYNNPSSTQTSDFLLSDTKVVEYTTMTGDGTSHTIHFKFYQGDISATTPTLKADITQILPASGSYYLYAYMYIKGNIIDTGYYHVKVFVDSTYMTFDTFMIKHSPPGNLTGTVVDDATSIPIAGATVEADSYNWGTRTASTDASGNYIVTALNADSTNTVRVSKSGYVKAERTTEIPVGGNTTLDLRLQKGGRISGHIMDYTTSDDIEDASVSASPGGYYYSSSSSGYYFLDVPDGTYNISVSKPSYQSISVTVVVSGADVTKDIVLTPIHTLSGYVLDTGKPISGATIYFSPGGKSTTTGSSGQYSVDLPDGTYTMTISASEYVTKTLSVTLSGHNEDQDIDLVPAQSDNSHPNADGGSDSQWIVLMVVAVVVVFVAIAAVRIALRSKGS